MKPYLDLLLGLLAGVSIAVPGPSALPMPAASSISAAAVDSLSGYAGHAGHATYESHAPVLSAATLAPSISASAVPEVPFYSQFTDIAAPAWKKVGCGVASLAMLIQYYHPGTVSVNALLKEGIAAGAYLKNDGWTHGGLARLADAHGLRGTPYDLAHLDKSVAFAQLAEILKSGPVIASVHYTFDPANPIPHLAVITGIEGDRVYFNDPAGEAAGGSISVADFIKSWKKRFIVVRA